jgi:hypothetical protein
MSQIEANEFGDYTETHTIFATLGFDDDEIENLGFEYLIPDNEEEE